jgi:hypothetical protein
MKFRRQGPLSESTVEPFLNQPGGELGIAVEAEARKHMSDDVMDSPKSVVGTADPVGQEGVLAVALRGGGGDLEDAVGSDGADHLVVRGVWCSTAREFDLKSATSRTISCQMGEDLVRLLFELTICGARSCIVMSTYGGKESCSYFSRKRRVYIPRTWTCRPNHEPLLPGWTVSKRLEES